MVDRAITDALDPPAPNGTPPELEPPSSSGPAVEVDSLIVSLRAQAAALRAQQTVNLVIPGYSGQLWARYRAINLPGIYITPNGQPRNMADWRVAADALVQALEGIYVRAAAGAELVPLAGAPRFDDDLVATLELEPAERTARAVAVAAFGGEQLGESRLWGAFLQYQAWLTATGDTEAPEVAETLGEYRTP